MFVTSCCGGLQEQTQLNLLSWSAGLGRDSTFWSTMEHTSSLTADSDCSVGSRLTVSLVRPIWSKKETPWMDPCELERPGWPPLDSWRQRVAGGLGNGDDMGGASGWRRLQEERGDEGGGLLSADIGCYLRRCTASREVSDRKNIQKVLQVDSVLQGDSQVNHEPKVSPTDASQKVEFRFRFFEANLQVCGWTVSPAAPVNNEREAGSSFAVLIVTIRNIKTINKTKSI